VSVTPNSGTALLGETLTFSAEVSNTTDTVVSWSVNNILGGSAQVGTISADGVYTAPADLPAGGTVQVTATSHADSSKSGTVRATISSDISVSLSPGTSNVELGSTQSFHASITSNGRPDPTIRWSVSGSACPNSCGTIDGGGKYTAPQDLPNAANVTVTATSVADPSRQNSASVTVTSSFTLQIAAPASLQTGVTAAIVATLTPVPGSNPDVNLSWALSGSGCGGSACGILAVTTTQSAGGGSISDTADYTAPQPDTVVITVTPQADAGKKVQVTIAIQPGTGISLSPSTQTIAVNHRFTLTVTENAATNATRNWSVNGILGGNSTFGQVCQVGSGPCQSVTSSTALQVDYLAPGAIPTPNPFSVTATDANNPLLTASSQVTVINHILVSVQPGSITLPPLGVQGFTATVLGTGNHNIVWQIQGAGCAANSEHAASRGHQPGRYCTKRRRKRHRFQRPEHSYPAPRQRVCRSR